MMFLLSFLNIELLVLPLLLLSGVHGHVLDVEDEAPPADEAGMVKKEATGQDVAKLEDSLGKSWRELDRMLFCTKLPNCVTKYNKVFTIGNQKVTDMEKVESMQALLASNF